MMTMERPNPGVNGHIAPVTEHGVAGYRFEAPDGTRGPFHPEAGKSGPTRAFYHARGDWEKWLADRKPAIAPR